MMVIEDILAKLTTDLMTKKLGNLGKATSIYWNKS